jgi:hypothetical protein
MNLLSARDDGERRKSVAAHSQSVSQSRESRRIRLLSSAHYWLGICWWLAGLAGRVEGRTAEHEGVVALSPRLGSLSQLTRLCVRGCEHTPVVPPPSEWPCSRATQTRRATSTRAPPGSTASTRSSDMQPPDLASRRPTPSRPKVSHSNTTLIVSLENFCILRASSSRIFDEKHYTVQQVLFISIWNRLIWYFALVDTLYTTSYYIKGMKTGLKITNFCNHNFTENVQILFVCRFDSLSWVIQTLSSNFLTLKSKHLYTILWAVWRLIFVFYGSVILWFALLSMKLSEIEIIWQGWLSRWNFWILSSELIDNNLNHGP